MVTDSGLAYTAIVFLLTIYIYIYIYIYHDVLNIPLCYQRKRLVVVTDSSSVYRVYIMIDY
jgi:hypothetical protein